MKPIGGYFELDLRRGAEYHDYALRLNTGRNALELILNSRKYSRVYIPYYTCDVILEPLIKLSVRWTFYAIDENLEPIFDFAQMTDNEAFLYINYFGVKESVVVKLSSRCKNLIIDNSQAFFSMPIAGNDTFYSCRKFFGVPDGAYLYMEGADSSAVPTDVSVERCMHLLKRIEYGPNAGYDDFKANDRSLIGQPIMQMSNLTRSLLCSIDYEAAKERRKANVKALHDSLSELNELRLSIDDGCVPMVYPFLSKNTNLKKKLIENNIYVATYWPNVLESVTNERIEWYLTKNIVPLPIDHRYDSNDMVTILTILEENL